MVDVVLMGDPRIAAIPVTAVRSPLVDLRDVGGFWFSDALADRSNSFTKVRTAWWHWSYGDRYWAFITDAGAAKFGPVDDG